MNAKPVDKKDGPGKPPEPPSVLRQTLARNVRIFRADQRMSQRELAIRAGTSHRRISEIETAKKNISLQTIAALAKALGKTELELVTPLT